MDDEFKELYETLSEIFRKYNQGLNSGIKSNVLTKGKMNKIADKLLGWEKKQKMKDGEKEN